MVGSSTGVNVLAVPVCRVDVTPDVGGDHIKRCFAGVKSML